MAEPDRVGAQTCPRMGVIGRNDISTRTHASFLAARRFALGQSVFVQPVEGMVRDALQVKYTCGTAPNGATIRLAAEVMSAWETIGGAGDTWPGSMGARVRGRDQAGVGDALGSVRGRLADVPCFRGRHASAFACCLGNDTVHLHEPARWMSPNRRSRNTGRTSANSTRDCPSLDGRVTFHQS